jgi:hypothetical protein
LVTLAVGRRTLRHLDAPAARSEAEAQVLATADA